MSLATRCPSCGTAFRVVQDQLKVSEGWVRCGHCQDVFNALESLFDLEPVARHKASVPMPLEQPAPSKARTDGAPWAAEVPAQPDQQDRAGQPPSEAATAPEATASAEVAVEVAVEDFWAAVAAPDPADARPPVPDLPLDLPSPAAPGLASEVAAPALAAEPPTPARAEVPAQSDGAVPSAPTDPGADPLDTAGPTATPAWTGIRRRRGTTRLAARPLVPRPLASGETTHPSLFAPESLLPAGGTSAAALPTPAAPAFVRKAERAARWQSPAWRATLAATALLLLLVLGLQASVFQRDLLANRWPILLPVLRAACQPLNCAVGAPRDIDHLVLDNSRLAHTAQPDVLQLVAELHNRSDRAVRKPALDVSFTDASGQQVARKVFLPQQLDGGDARLEANTPWRVDIRLRTPSLAITGFTMEVFYP